jgi:3-oxoacyl-[acyl-carrier protein] reductase
VSSYAADVTQFSEMQGMADAAAKAHGGIDILCVNAGVFPQARIEDLAPEDWDRVLPETLDALAQA